MYLFSLFKIWEIILKKTLHVVLVFAFLLLNFLTITTDLKLGLLNSAINFLFLNP